MKIGIIVHSKTGTTLEYAKLIAERLKEHGHQVDLTELKTDVPVEGGSVRGSKKFSILNIPDCSEYEAILIGGPVWGLSASPVVIACLKELRGVEGKKILPFVTMGFPFAGMGGSQAVSLMSRTAAGLGAQVLPGKIIPKLFRNFRQQMERTACEIPAHFVS